ncbi:MAG: hypothetical protein EOP06_14905 [Proteobacteria bacterium]|nr:MAG: hypothetical protein EOP06_14905 [Pseudomonadota bacterium]
MKTAIKCMILASTLTLAIAAQAADKKIGSVVAVERSVENILTTCVDQVKKDKYQDPTGQYFSCSYAIVKPGESIPAGQRFLALRTSECNVDAEAKDTKVVVFFGGNDMKSNLTTAQNCLETALQEKKINDFKVIVHTVE